MTLRDIFFMSTITCSCYIFALVYIGGIKDDQATYFVILYDRQVNTSMNLQVGKLYTHSSCI